MGLGIRLSTTARKAEHFACKRLNGAADRMAALPGRGSVLRASLLCRGKYPQEHSLKRMLLWARRAQDAA